MHMTAKTFNLGEAKFTPLQVPSQLYVHEPDTLHGTPAYMPGTEMATKYRVYLRQGIYRRDEASVRNSSEGA